MEYSAEANRGEELCKARHFDKTVENLKTFWKEAKYTDLVVKVKDAEFPCHKAVLAAACSYFDVMFSSGMKESFQNVIELKDVEPDIIKCLLEFVYTGELASVTMQNIKELIRIADQFQFQQLTEACDIFLCKNFDNEDLNNNNGYLQFLIWGKACGLKTFVQKYLEFICTNIEVAVLCNDDALKVLDEQTMIEIIKKDGLVLSNENLVYELVNRWVNMEPKIRESRFGHIIKYVRLAFCTPDFLLKVVEVDSRMATPKCQKMLQVVKDFQSCPLQTQHEIVTTITTPRIAYNYRRLWMVGGEEINDIDYLDETEEIDSFYVEPCNNILNSKLSNGKVNVWAAPLGGLEILWHTYTMTSDTLLVTGGFWNAVKEGRPDICAALWVDHSVDGTPTIVRLLGTMLEGRNEHSAVLVEDLDCLFIFGGHTSDTTVTGHVERLTLERDNKGRFDRCAAEPLSDMPVAVCKAASTLFGSTVFIFGGETEIDCISTTQVFDLDLEVWSHASDMPAACSDAAAVRYNNDIYVVGGEDKLCMRYTPSMDTWVSLKGPTFPHSNSPAVVWCGKILIGGGGNPTDYVISEFLDEKNKGMRCLEHYDPTTEEWSTWTWKFPKGLFYHYFFNVPAKPDSNVFF